MAKWRNGGMAGMAVRRKEWQNSRMAEMATYVLFMVHTDDDDDDDDDDNDTLIFYSVDKMFWPRFLDIQMWACIFAIFVDVCVFLQL
jgi:hypothetical protein